MTKNQRKVIRQGILIFIATMTTFYGIHNKTFAADNDCYASIWDIKTSPTIDGITLNINRAFTQEMARKAIENLTAYCCKEKLYNNTKDKTVKEKRCEWEAKEKLPSFFADSAFLYDHIIDVRIRSLDGLKKNESDPNTLYPTLDPTGIKRRGFIRTVAQNPNGEISSKILPKYTQYRGLKNDFNDIERRIEDFSSWDVKKLANFLKDYRNPPPEDNDITTTLNVTLADKYNNICFLAANIYKSPAIRFNNTYYKACRQLIAHRVAQENLLVKSIIINQANQLLLKNLTKITNEQFAQDKLMNLLGTIGDVRDLLFTIVKQAYVNACKKCSH